MPARNELAVRARAVGLDPNTYPNDSKLEQKVLWLEKRATTFAGTAGSQILTSNNTQVTTADTVTVGDFTYTFRTALTGAYATATLTSDATNPSDGDTFALDGVTYTFRTTLTTPARPYEVKIGADAATTLDYVKDAVNATAVTAGAGTGYSVGTLVHPTVTATTNTNTTQLFRANNKGTYANSFVSVENGTHTSFGSGNFSGGVNVVANEVLIGADADGSLTNLKNAVAQSAGTAGTDYSENTPVNPYGTFGSITAHAMTFTTTDFSVTNASTPTTDSAVTLTWTGATLAGGVAKVVAVDSTTVNGSAGLSGDRNV